jgi:hypothetical protein
VSDHIGNPTLFPATSATEQLGPVECLGMTFENDEKRREYFLEKLRDKLKDPAFRQIEGFPIASDEDILAMSDPPYYTACPNPFIENFITENTSTSALLEKQYAAPFATDITEGKSDHYYNVHTYHTKVPYRAIARFVLHYTLPGSIILDNFCGTGMTGLAVQACSNPDFVRELDPMIPKDRIGPRLTILTDLSPAVRCSWSYKAQPILFEQLLSGQSLSQRVFVYCTGSFRNVSCVYFAWQDGQNGKGYSRKIACGN